MYLETQVKLTKLKGFVKKKKIILIEDTCESLGVKYKNKFLGTYGDFGTYSFYYSHQITSGEGGMVVCNNKKDYQILHTMRAHGWSRGIKVSKELKKKYQNIDDRFFFLNSGFNLRPLDVSASIGNNQLKRINQFIKIRNYNRKKIIDRLDKFKILEKSIHFFKSCQKCQT